MAIEPIGSMMSLQAQTVMPQETGKPVAESTDATAQEVGAQLDRTTAGVAKVQEKTAVTLIAETDKATSRQTIRSNRLWIS